MTVRFYIMPLTVVASRRGPKYLKWRDNPTGIDAPWAMVDYGFQPTCLVAAEVDTTQHSSLNANADLMAAPADLDSTIGNAAQRDNVKAKLDTLDPPNEVGPQRSTGQAAES